MVSKLAGPIAGERESVLHSMVVCLFFPSRRANKGLLRRLCLLRANLEDLDTELVLRFCLTFRSFRDKRINVNASDGRLRRNGMKCTLESSAKAKREG